MTWEMQFPWEPSCWAKWLACGWRRRVGHESLVGLGVGFLTLFTAGPLCAVDGPQTWNSFDLGLAKTDAVQVSLYSEAHLARDGMTLSWFAGPRLQMRLSERWSLGGALKRIELPSSVQSRLELEGTAGLWSSELSSARLRTRIELRRATGGHFTSRLRSRLVATWRRGGADAAPTVYSSLELFVGLDPSIGRLAQARLVPIGLAFRPRPDLRVFAFYLLQFSRAGDWSIDHVMGLSVRFDPW